MRHSCGDFWLILINLTDAISSDISTLHDGDKPIVNKLGNTQNNVQACSVQPTFPCLIDKGLDVIANNQEAIIILSFGLAITVFCWGLGKGISEVVAKIKQ
jgi:hypothetical protein